MADCCAIPSKNQIREQSICPTCGQKGKPVEAQTIRSLTRQDWPEYSHISDGYLCTNPNDPTVYFIPTENLVINKRYIVVRVGLKEKDEPIYVCYCFQHTKVEIESDYLEHDHSTIEDDIRQKVKENLCACEFKNPSGRCCLGDVRKTYQSLTMEAAIV